MRRIVHISGYTLGALQSGRHVVARSGAKVTYPHRDWEHVCWGDPANHLLGRIPMGLWLARYVGAQHIVWSTGASRIPDGAWESEYMFELAQDSFSRLKRDFPRWFRGKKWQSEEVHREWLKKVSIFDTQSVDTRTSMDFLQRHVAAHLTRVGMFVYVVSSANHAARALRDAERAFGIGMPQPGNPNVILSATPAQTCYGGKTLTDVVVKDLGD